jgi:serine/threonine-protein kinase HipA
VSPVATVTTTMADLPSVKRIRVADVYKGDRLAAKLRRTDVGVVFRYADDYLARGAPQVATTLPLTDHPLLTPAGAVPAFFAGLLPEGRRLTGLRRAVKTSADDELSLLLAVGSDPVGDVRVLPEHAEPATPQPLVSVDRSFEEVSFTEVLEAAGVVDPVALAGVQDKASARVMSVPIGQAGRRYILKVDPPEYPHLVANEHYFLQLAARRRLPVVRANVVHDMTGRPGLLVERFDRIATVDGRSVALPVEDGAQVLGVYPADKYAVTAERVTRGLGRLCAAQLVALRDIYRQLCFAWLTGNGDLHAKNLSVIGSTDGEWQIAPAYDIPTTLPYRDHTLALSMGGKVEGLSRGRLLSFAAGVGLPERAAERVLDAVLAATEPVIDDWSAGALPFDKRTVTAVLRSLRSRRRPVQA